MRNPPWERDELILALDLYLKSYPNIPSNTNESVISLSQLLNSLPIHSKATYGDSFRNPNSVSMKLSNFSALDPRYTRKGLKSVSKGDKRVWNEFYSKQQQLNLLATSIHNHILSDVKKELENIVDIEEEFSEGRVLYKVHKTRERNRSLINKKKQEVFQKTFNLSCEVCGFDFKKIYGDLGDGYIECHHNKPVSSLNPNEKTKLSDISILCANCHRMIHHAKPWILVEELKNKINRNKLWWSL